MPQKIVNLLIVTAILLVILVFSFPYLSKLWTNRAKPTEQTTVQSDPGQLEKPLESVNNPNSTSTTDQTENPENSPTQPSTAPESQPPSQESPVINQNRGNYDEMKDAYSRDII